MEITCNTTRVINKPRDDEGIGDTGTTDHFLKEGAPADEITLAENPIEIEMPNGTIERSTHTCYLRIAGLLKKYKEDTSCLASATHHWCLLENYVKEDVRLYLRRDNAKYGTKVKKYLLVRR